ncbi:MAG: T9SS type A sorting domain-containing protein [Bacteroidales bacterium]|nr:T9SS type A sorting domain-containing protein [Bacteroidales bacterium]
MKRHVILTLLLLCFGLTNAQQTIRFRSDHPQGVSIEKSTSDELCLHYALSEISIANIDNDEAKGQEIIMKGSFGSFAEGLPNLPFENHYIALPKGATVSITVKENGSTILNDIDLLPAAEVIRNDAAGLPMLYKNMSVYSQNANFPVENVKIAQSTQIRKLDVALLNITPFRYNPVQKTLEVVYDMDIDIRFEGGNGRFGEARYLNPEWEGILRDLVVNSDMLPETHYYDLLSEAVNDRGPSCEYLIISPDDERILEYANTLKQFRTKQGILTKVVTITECGGNDAETIKNYIKNAYEHWNIPPAAVLVFSGCAVDNTLNILHGIPEFPLIFLNYNDTGENHNYLSDNPYADMNGDSIPDLALSRLPIEKFEDYKTIIDKLLKYETNPPTNPEYYNRPLITSGYEYNKWFLITSQTIDGFYRNKLGKRPNNYYMYYVYSSDSIVLPETAWSTGYNTDAVVDYFGPNGQNYIAQTPDTLNNWRDMFDYSYLIDALNRGSFLTLYRDHSGADLWCCPWIGTDNLLGLKHDTIPTFVISIGCHTGEPYFTYSNVTGQLRWKPLVAALCNDEVGALGGIGAASVTHSHFNDILTWGFYDYIWADFMPGLGTLSQPAFARPSYGLVAGKLFLNQHTFLPNWWPQKVTTTQNVFHYLGETYLNLYTEVPQPLAIEAGNFTDDQSHYTITAEQGALACLTRNDKILCVVQTTGSPQSIRLPKLPIGEHLCLTVTKQNRFRFEKEVIVIAPDKPHVYAKEFLISSHDDNGQIDAGEMVDIDIILHNASGLLSDNGTITLECASPYVEIIKNTSSYPKIDPGATRTIRNAFRIGISGEIPDQTTLDFKVRFKENENTHGDPFSSNANAPVVIIHPEIRMLTADGQPSTHISTEGNSSVVFTISNTGHAPAHYLNAILDVKAPFITNATSNNILPTLKPNEELPVTFELNTSPNDITGAWLKSRLVVQYERHSINLDTILQYGGIFEDAETDELNPFFKWYSYGSHKWDHSAEDPYEGQFCLESNASTNTVSVLKAQLKAPHVKHNCRVSFYYKTGNGDTLQYYNKANINLSCFSSDIWHYAEVDYNGIDIYFVWSYKKQNEDSPQVKIDDICFPPLHTTIAFAGEEATACGDTPVELAHAYAYDCDLAWWTTDGDGHFESDTTINTQYHPGDQDLANGMVTLTLTAIGKDTVTSSTRIHFVNGINPGTIAGDNVVNKYTHPITHYSIDDPQGLRYRWTLDPDHAGVIYDNGNEIDIVWDQLGGVADVTLTAIAENNCSNATITKQISLIGYSTSEWHPVDFTLYPNPTDGKVNLIFGHDLSGKVLVEVFNLLGERMASKTFSHIPEKGMVTLDLSRLVPGLYIVRLNTEKGGLSKKVSLR